MLSILSLLPALLLALLACLLGVALSYYVFETASLKTRLCAGIVAGMAFLAWTSFLISLLTGVNRIAITTVFVCLVAALTLLRRQVARVRGDLRNARLPNAAGWCWALLWGGFFCWLFSRVIMSDADGLHTSPVTNYGDLGFHFSVVTSFADGDNLPPRNPIFNGLRFTYPFLMDFLTAFFHRTGANWAASFFISNIFLMLALVGLIEVITERLTGSRLAARIAVPLFFFNGGIGFFYFLQDFGVRSTDWLTFMLHLPRSYTMNDALHLRWSNVLTTLILPQRSLLFGLPVAAAVILLWWEALGQRDSSARRRFAAAGLLTGLLPLLHAHGFLSLMMVAAGLTLLFWSREWLAFFAPALGLAVPQALWLSGTGVKSSLFKPQLGWEAGAMSPLEFWAINAGVFISLLAVSLVAGNLLTSQARRFYLPFLVCFILPNLVLLAPWSWDNIKVLTYWYLASCPLVALLLARLLSFNKWPARLAGAFSALLLLLGLTLSGALDVVRALSPVENVRIFDAQQLEAAAAIRRQTPPRSLILHAPTHNSVIALTGRQSLMGYPGHLWSHGIDYAAREQQVKQIYQGGLPAVELLRDLGIDYVVIGPVERESLNADEGFFAAQFKLVIDVAGYRIYQVNGR